MLGSLGDGRLGISVPGPVLAILLSEKGKGAGDKDLFWLWDCSLGLQPKKLSKLLCLCCFSGYFRS
jgi:hypothetical protein